MSVYEGEQTPVGASARFECSLRIPAGGSGIGVLTVERFPDRQIPTNSNLTAGGGRGGAFRVCAYPVVIATVIQLGIADPSHFRWN